MEQSEHEISDHEFCLTLDVCAAVIKDTANGMDDTELRKFMATMCGASDEGERYLCITFMRTLSVDEHAEDREFWLRAVLCSPETVQTRIMRMLEFGSMNVDGRHYDEFAGNALNSLTALKAMKET